MTRRAMTTNPTTRDIGRRFPVPPGATTRLRHSSGIFGNDPEGSGRPIAAASSLVYPPNDSGPPRLRRARE